MERGALRETGDANGKVPMMIPPNLLSPFPLVSPNLGYMRIYLYIYIMATYMYIIINASHYTHIYIYMCVWMYICTYSSIVFFIMIHCGPGFRRPQLGLCNLLMERYLSILSGM